MKKGVIAIVMVMMLTGILFTGCGKSDIGAITVGEGDSAIYIKKDGSVTYVICESFSEDYYDKGELKKIIKDEIDDFNAGGSSSSIDSAKLASFKVKKEVATATITFKTVEDFVGYAKEFNGEDDEEIFIGTISDASAAGYKISGDFTVVEKGKATEEVVKGSKIKETEGNLIFLKEQMIVQIEGKDVKYITSNCKIKDGVVTITDDEKAIIVY